MQADAVFMSPPWGGPAYAAAGGGFAVAGDLGGLGAGLAELLAAGRGALGPGGRGVAVFLPRNALLAQVTRCSLRAGRCWDRLLVVEGGLVCSQSTQTPELCTRSKEAELVQS